MSVTYLVKSWLDMDSPDLSGAVRICLLLHRCLEYVDPDLLRRCVDFFDHHGLPLCCISSALMMAPDPARMKMIQAVVDRCASGAVDVEIVELERIGRVLPSTRHILTLINRHTVE